MRQWSSWQGKLKPRRILTSVDFIVDRTQVAIYYGRHCRCWPSVQSWFSWFLLVAMWQCHALALWQSAKQQMWDGRHKDQKRTSSPFFKYLAQPRLVVGTHMIDFMPFLWVLTIPTNHLPAVWLIGVTGSPGKQLLTENIWDIIYVWEQLIEQMNRQRAQNKRRRVLFGCFSFWLHFS